MLSRPQKTDRSKTLIPGFLSSGANGPVSKPQKTVVPLAVGLAWRGGGGFIYQEKMDGRFETRMEGGRWMIAGERMKDGRFFGFDCLAVDGQDIRRAPLRERLPELAAAILYPLSSILPVPTGSGGEFLEAVLARGGEGVVAKDLSAPYGEMIACKRIWEGLCVVTGFCGGTQSVEISRIEGAKMEGGRWMLDGQDMPLQSAMLYPPSSLRPAGRVTLRGGKVDRVRVGSVLKVQGMNLTARGMIREPRVCADTPDSWLVQF